MFGHMHHTYTPKRTRGTRRGTDENVWKKRGLLWRWEKRILKLNNTIGRSKNGRSFAWFSVLYFLWRPQVTFFRFSFLFCVFVCVCVFGGVCVSKCDVWGERDEAWSHVVRLSHVWMQSRLWKSLSINVDLGQVCAWSPVAVMGRWCGDRVGQFQEQTGFTSTRDSII